MKSISTAYLLWVLGIFGCLGLHHLYLENNKKGLLWFFTGGFFGIGSIYDFFTLRSQTKDFNIRKRLGISDSRQKKTMPGGIIKTLKRSFLNP